MEKKILIFAATYNEAENIKNFIEKIFELNIELDLLIIDDNSPDKTWEIVESYSKRNKKNLLRQNIYSKKSYVQAKMYPSPRNQMCTQIIEGNIKGYEGVTRIIMTSNSFVFPSMIWVLSDLERMDASLIARNFFIIHIF